MTAPQRAPIADWINALLLWLFFAFSLGCCRITTYCAREEYRDELAPARRDHASTAGVKSPGAMAAP
jgi:hypothetical protein